MGLKAAIPAMYLRKGGSFIITSSVAGLTGSPGVAPYGTSKHAAIGLMRSAAKECAEKNIRVNTVNPSPVETRMMRSLEEGLMPGQAIEAKKMFEANIVKTLNTIKRLYIIKITEHNILIMKKYKNLNIYNIIFSQAS